MAETSPPEKGWEEGWWRGCCSGRKAWRRGKIGWGCKQGVVAMIESQSEKRDEYGE